MRYSVDIETALADQLRESGYSSSAHAIPATLGKSFPHIHVERTGGYTQDMVIESNNVDFDVYAEDAADAMTAASDLCGWVRELAGTEAGEICYFSEVTTLPYNNPDPRHPNIGRATFKAQLLTRIRSSKNA